jgi:hypothetical protein
MAAVIYGLCALTALACAYLLLRAYGRERHKLLLWSGVCFAGLTVNNLMLIVDKIVLPDVDLATARTGVALLSMMVLLFGLIWEAQ